MKRTTFMVDETLLEDAKKALKAKTNSEAIEMALKEAVRVDLVRGLSQYFGKVEWVGDLDEMRKDRKFPPMASKAKAGK
jgi:Arc/MetJ family transcription regulator